MEAQRVIPMLSYEDAGAAADWIVDAFGFTETGRWSDDTGCVTHVNLELGGSELMVGWPSAEYESPRHHAETCVQARRWSETPHVVDGVLVYVDDIEAHFMRASAAGARILTPVEANIAVGQRQYRAEDVEGHRWMFAEATG